jgi:hypothetical protein
MRKIMNDGFRARVFLSCGQKEGQEREIASKIAMKLKKLDYDPYIAVEEQTLRGFTQNILPRLDESEYYIFVDFKREQLVQDSERKEHRGSLFSHQELGIATFLDKPVIAFQEQGVKRRDGLIGFLQINTKQFSDRNTLPDEIIRAVKKQNWNPRWRNELILEREKKTEYEDAVYRPLAIQGRWYHINIKNLHERKMAVGCVAYLESIRDISTGEVRVPEPVEFKWKGMKTAKVAIPPKTNRLLDAFFVFCSSPNIVYLSINQFLVDFSGFHDQYTLKGPNDYELEYVIFSANFSPVKGSFILQIAGRLQDIKFHKNNIDKKLKMHSTITVNRRRRLMRT